MSLAESVHILTVLGSRAGFSAVMTKHEENEPQIFKKTLKKKKYIYNPVQEPTWC